MAGATYDAANQVAYVKPGGEWNDVVGDLEPSGVTIAGGRLGQSLCYKVFLIELNRLKALWELVAYSLAVVSPF